MRGTLSFYKKFIVLAGIIICLFLAILFPQVYAPAQVLAAGPSSDRVNEMDSASLSALADILEDHPIYGCIYLCTSYSLLSAPDMNSESVIELSCGSTVTICDAFLAEDGYGDYIFWYEVETVYRGITYHGYVDREYLAISDEAFLDWESMYACPPVSYYMTIYGGMPMMMAFALDDPDPGIAPASEPALSLDVAQFPESYQAALSLLKANHPNWIFVPYDTNLDWQSVINNEIGYAKSLVPSTYYGYHREGYAESGWYYAAENTLKWYMDPRAWLDEDHIFQFELLSYNASYHTESALDAFLATSFMKSTNELGTMLCAPGTRMSYAQLFSLVGSELNVSPFHLASRVYQEQGKDGSTMISGTYPGYEGLYNYFNVNVPGGAGATATDKLVQGLTYARTKGWTSAEASIRGGAELLAQNYIAQGQDTVYLQKFNVTPTNTYTHQYMQNIAAPSGEAVTIRNMYRTVGSLDNSFVFKIPVYTNMPAMATTKPTSSTNLVFKIPRGYSSEVYIDGVLTPGVSRNGQYIVNAGNKNASTIVAYAYDSKQIPVNMYVWTAKYKDNYYEVTERPELENLLSYHGFAIRISGNSGIRYISGIRTDARDAMLGDGLNGLHLQEYGTLIMNNKNLGPYPFVYGGEKVQTATAYNSSLDNIYKVEDGRTKYTAVLTGIPANQYKAELAFRSYAIVTDGSKRYVLYGPYKARSIYDLAQTYLSLGSYAAGSSENNFLKKIVKDAQ